MRLVILTMVVGSAILIWLVELLRRRQLREKYAALWLGIAPLIPVLALFPSSPDAVARLLGVQNGVSLVLFLGVAFLLAIAMQLSLEVSRLDERTRVLSEEIALLRLDAPSLPHRSCASGSCASGPCVCGSGARGSGSRGSGLTGSSEQPAAGA